MLTWRDTVIHTLLKNFSPEIVIITFSFLKREHILHLCEESRDYHVYRMPFFVERLFYTKSDHYPVTQGSYLNIKINYDFEEAATYSEVMEELTDKWYTIDPKGKEYTYMDVWRWNRFTYPYMNFIYSFNRGRIFLRFLKGYEWYDLYSEDNIVDKLTEYKPIIP